ncbi:pyridoxamine 5'-phosphate oxidase family protein [Curtobacterium caseinilyticum]|uniref:Pyridoxamine 5'-phosphate oxidase family protein n=1 Tax=Curtobacterium caseinilyticum TaxID=3055137 RepID=A0ABT7TM96_9MICO|nr:pyridoxamine 5'-phosphate oxidase family protein [Curtobacterium caseinilyticum]MDM7890710.1 pyridoxamine 5'-phosphate oxidase family protein [Curtobacterium caseinilyticum]
MTVLPGQVAASTDGAAAPADPLVLAASWLPSTEDGPGPTMTLSTLGLDGYPAARTVLLSRFDGERLHFHTDSRSRKAAELAALPRAAVTLVWPEVARQLVVVGDVARVTDAEARAAYAARTRYLQVLAWVNDHEAAADTADRRRELWAAFEQDRPELEPPDSWVGFALTPVRMLFWRGSTDAASNRLAYERHPDGGWSQESWPG